MAARDEQAPINWFSPLDALRRVQELGAQLSGIARSFTEPQERDDAEYDTDEDETAVQGAKRGSFLPQPFAAWAEGAAELSTTWVAPMRAVLQEQQDLIDAMSSWAEEQRKLADRFAELANRHREVTADLFAVLTPSLDNLDLLAGRKPAKKAAKQSAKRTTTAKKRA